MKRACKVYNGLEADNRLMLPCPTRLELVSFSLSSTLITLMAHGNDDEAASL